MRCTPVKRSRKPAYPTRLQVLADPELLDKNLPKGWARVAGPATALSIFLAVNGCVQSQQLDTSSNQQNAVSYPSQQTPAAIEDTRIATVAPIFQHGVGRGVTGCVVAAPPVFLSEEEALVIIREEMKTAGIPISEKPVTLESVNVPLYEGIEQIDNEYFKKIVGSKPLEADGQTENQSIAVEFISQSDHNQLTTEPIISTVQEYDFQKVAKDLGERVTTSSEKIYFGAFYDPAVKVNPPTLPLSNDDSDTNTNEDAVVDYQQFWNTQYAKAQAESKELLKEQVKDFVDWLKAQGVI